MYPLNDNDLDRLSREAADQYDVQPGTSGWETLENRLNRELPLKEEKERRRFLFWLFFIVLLAGGGLLWMMTNKDNNTIQVAHADSVTPAENGTQNTNPAANKPSPNVGTTPARDGAASSVPESKTPVPDAAANAPVTVTTAPADAATATATIPNKSKVVPQPQPATALSQPAAVPAATAKDGSSLTLNNTNNAGSKTRLERIARKRTGSGQTNGETNSLIRRNHTSGTIPGDKPNDDKDLPAQDAVTDDLLKASMVNLTGLPVGDRSAIQAPPLNPAVTPAPEKAPIENKQPKNRGLEIGLVAGPDMSNVKFTDIDKAGYNVGLQIGYRFSDRWSVNTAFLYTRKNYTAGGKDWTKTGWWRYTDMHSVQGYCQMFDIPLNVRYDFTVNKKQRWFASAGASSYIMNKEYYDYDYTYNGVRRKADWTRDSTSTYLFSILNFSAGFERALNKRFSLQAEPYFKFPLKGLGYGKLDLNSYGIYFSVKYKLGK